MLNIDKTKLRADIKATTDKIRALKEIKRESGQPRMSWKVNADLEGLKYKATMLCCIMAQSRGRLHMPGKMDLPAQLQHVEFHQREYARPEVPASAAA